METLRALRPAHRGGQPTGIGWLLLAILVGVPWLIPGHAAPWPSFDGELAMAAAFVAPAAWALFRGGRRWSVDALAAGFVVVAVVPIAQAAAGLFVLPGEAGLVSLYLLAIGLIMLVAAQADRIAPGRMIDALWAGLVLAAVLSTGIVFYQWARLDSLGVLIEIPGAGGRLAANIGQPNLLASLLVWGLVGIWWGVVRGSIGAAGAWFAAAFLLFGVVMTQSRAGWLEVALLGVAAAVFRARLGTARQARGWFALGLWFIASIVVWGALSDDPAHEGVRSAADQLSAGKRPQIWALMLRASFSAPWFGFGWNQGMQAHTAVAERYPDLHVIVQGAHNLALDLVVWNGWPLGLLLILGLGARLVRAALRARTAQELLILVGLATFLLHAMLELPHCLFLFLAPAAVLAGTLAARQPLPLRWTVPRGLVGGLVLMASAALGTMFFEYRAIESDLSAYRIRNARIGDMTEPPPLKLYVLAPLQEALQAMRVTPRRDMVGAELDGLRQAVERYPTDGALFKLAQASAWNGRPDDAAWALRRLCLFYPPSACDAAAVAWQASAAADPSGLLGRTRTPWAAGSSPPSTP